MKPIEDKPIERKERDSTPEESDVMNRYLDLSAQVYKAPLLADERKDLAQNLIDLVNILNEGKNIDTVVREDLLKGIKRLDNHYVKFVKVVDLSRQLERVNLTGGLDSGLYERLTSAAKEALNAGVPESVIEPIRHIVRKYLSRVNVEHKRQKYKN